MTFRIMVGFATCGRADVIRHAIGQLRAQTRTPDKIVVCYAQPSDIEGVEAGADIIFVQGGAGLPEKRNVILDHAEAYDILLFLDDDFLVAPTYIACVEAAMGGNDSIVATTGTPIADDVKGPGLTVPEGLSLIANSDPTFDTGYDQAAHGYGCNMAIRLDTARRHDVRFDEVLPLYAWSEDVDYTHRLAAHGIIVKLRGARGVHLGVKHGRSSGRRLGYSQVANPMYLHRKGSYSWRRAAGSVLRNLAANAARAAWPEAYIDRRGRLRGNVLAFADLCRGRLRPGRVLDL